MPYDLVIKDAKVVDGSGMPAYSADVAVQDGRIAEIGRVKDGGRKTIKADGLALSPGFIDHHTHLDAQLLWDGLGRSSPEHGVTTVITGNCGLSLMPAKPGDESALIGTFVRVEAIPREILESVDWSWHSVAEYFEALGKRLGINVGSMVGHNALRQYVMGDDATEREATPDEIAAMQKALRQAIEEGAIGYTINRNQGHYRDDGKPLPSRMASEEEMLALASVLSEVNAGIVQHSNMGAHKVENIDWYARLAQAARRPILWSSVNWRYDAPDLWREQLDYVEKYVQGGLRMYGNTNIRPTANRFTLRNTQGWDMYPTWKTVFSAPIEERRRSLADSGKREAMRRELDEILPRPGEPGFFNKRWDLIKVMKTTLDENKGLEQRSLEEIARLRGARHPMDVMFDIGLQEDLNTLFLRTEAQDDEVVASIIKSPYTNVGMSDAGAHVAFDAGFGISGLVLGYWVRQKGMLTLEQAVNLLSFKVASIFGLKDRGLVWPGWAADLALFDPDTVEALESVEASDYPGGFTRMVQHARGVHYTIVNGEVLLEQGEHTGAYPGRVIRNARAEAKAGV